MRYIDCFAGTGSMSLALHQMLGSVAAYCEIDPAAQAVLRRNMAKGLLPTAPIVDDVCTIDRTSPCAAEGIDAMTASWPCVGHSSMGLKEGLENVESKLFHQILRLCTELDLKMLFLENVRAMLTNGGARVMALLAEKGYTLHYAIIPAYAVGSPQHRERWFCVALRPGFSYRKTVRLRGPFTWSPDEGRIPRMVAAEGETRRKSFVRAGILGNALVPDQIRLGFVYLMTGRTTWLQDKPQTLTSDFFERPTGLTPFVTTPKTDCPPHGFVWNGGMYSLPAPRFQPPDLRLQLTATNFLSKVPVSAFVSSGLLDTKAMKCWATPRKTMTGACNVLTVRSAKDLPTQLRFERGTPKAMAGGIMNPEWVEWLMGFPAGWTDY